MLMNSAQDAAAKIEDLTFGKSIFLPEQIVQNLPQMPPNDERLSYISDRK